MLLLAAICGAGVLVAGCRKKCHGADRDDKSKEDEGQQTEPKKVEIAPVEAAPVEASSDEPHGENPIREATGKYNELYVILSTVDIIAFIFSMVGCVQGF